MVVGEGILERERVGGLEGFCGGFFWGVGFIFS